MRALCLVAFFCVSLFLVGCEEEESGFSFSREASSSNSNGSRESVFNHYPNLLTHYRLVAGDGRSCAFSAAGGFQVDYLDCWGRYMPADQREQVESNVSGSDQMLSIGDDHVCTTLSDFGGRRVHCDGSNQFGENTDPEPEEISGYEGHWVDDPYVVASGNHHNCVLDRFGAYCWGKNDQGQTDVPSLDSPKWIAAGGDTSCAIDGNDLLHCWGDNRSGQAQVPANLGTVQFVDVGAEFACAIKTTGDIECWGAINGWDEEPQQSYDNPVHISVGAYHACVLDEISSTTFALDCFGRENEEANLLTVPAIFSDAPGFNPITIDAGVGHSCMTAEYDGFLEGDSGNLEAQTVQGIACWGRNESNQSRPPQKACFGYYDQNSEEDRRCINF